ncbi:hypothetical protein BJ878DRAFT_427855 [Calycina marina]|uniref:SH3 domain-containing protein n=1 Tax=Calycina marina TaxID=1763456 RepID=A0A9P7YYG1_9HELO|nr:hypothetical protein BJ878DRAFT_427855 [Calycina marina]
MAVDGGRCCQSQRKDRSRATLFNKTALLSLFAVAVAPLTLAETCIPLSGSTQCPAFQTSSISVNSTLVGFFPFLASVSSRETFDTQLQAYVTGDYVQTKYEDLLGCSNINLQNTTNLYARYTITVICNSIVQNSKTPCGLSTADSIPVCAETCAQQASSEASIVTDSSLCSSPGTDADALIRADFTNCALPADSLGTNCVEGTDNEPNNCGFSNSTIGFCQYCGSGGLNSTDTCCYTAGAETRCAGVVLPTITTSMTFSTALPSSTSTSASSASSNSSPTPTASAAKKTGLSGGAIAGIVIGAIALMSLIIALIALLVCLRRRRGSQSGSVFNQPSPARRGTNSQGMIFNPVAHTTPDGYEVLPGGRIARMSALEGHSGGSPPRTDRRIGSVTEAAAAGTAAGYAGARRRHRNSSSDSYGESPVSNSERGVLRPPPTNRRNGSLSSNSMLGDHDPQSPVSESGEDLSSPHVASQQSEQLPFFKDYYSQDEIHPGDKVSTLWAYQPRAGDEFALERGDMLKVIGIWDDGWATGVLVNERAEEWDGKRAAQRDSGVSNTSGRREESPAVNGEIKAFPLVCVCVPDHWRKTIDGDGSTEAGSTQHGS